MRLTKTNISEFIEKVNSILEKKGLYYNDVAIMKTTLAEVNGEEYCGRGLVDLW